MTKKSFPGSSYVKRDTMLIVALIAVVIGFVGGIAFTVFKSRSNMPASQSASRQQTSQDRGASSGDADRLAALEKETAQHPERAQAWTELGNLYFDSEKFDQAIAAYQRSLAIDEKNANVWTDLGIMYRRTGQPKKALSAFDKAIEIDPGHEASRFNKGVVLMHDLDDVAGAIKAWEGLFKVNPLAMAPNGKSVLEMLEKLKKGNQ